MKYFHANFRLNRQKLWLFLAAIGLAACRQVFAGVTALPAAQPSGTMQPTSTTEPEITQPVTPQPLPSSGLPEGLIPLSPENALNVRELAVIAPESPPFFHFSEDGSTLATGDLLAVTIWDAASRKIISTIPAVLPDCGFGFGRIFRLNADGTFIALVNGPAIQVWQVGGGKIFTVDITSSGGTNPPACGADIPELALSPDGRLLAVSGIAFSRTTARRYFRVIDILANKVVYEWNGKKDGLHGNFYAFYGLGFSDDGSLLQTFDPVRFIRSQGNVHEAFRFWSVGDWLEVDRESALVKAHFEPGQLLFPLSDSGTLEAVDKTIGEITASSVIDGCTWDFPCETRFSPDSSAAAVLNRSAGATIIKNDSMYQALFTWTLANDTAINTDTIPLRDLEGIVVQNNGSLINANQISANHPETASWWAYKETFSGLQTDKDGMVTFTPRTAATTASQECPFCAACAFDPRENAMNCPPGITDSEGQRVSISAEDGHFFLKQQQTAGETVIGEIALPEKINLSKTHIRLLAYAMPQQTLFYCADEISRPVGCTIYDPYAKKVIASPEDISFLRFSPDGLKAAFINRRLNALFLYDLASQTLTRKTPYQARAYPVNPVFSDDGSTFFYVIQNLDNAFDLSVEALDAQSAKSLGRVSLRKAGIRTPTAFSVSNDGTLWMFANSDGEISILSPDKGTLLHQWQAHTDGIIGITADLRQKWLATMGENGILKFWGIQ